MKRIFPLLAFLFVSLSIKATTYTFTGYGDWTITSNWSPSYPGTTINAGDSVIFSPLGSFSFGTCQINQTNLIINGVLKIGINWSFQLLGNSNVQVSSSGTLINNWWLYLNNTSQIDIYGILDEHTTPYGSSTNMNDTSKIIIYPSGQFNLTDTLRIFDSAQVTVNGILTNDGSIWNYNVINGVGSIVSGSSTANGLIGGTGTVAPGLSPGELKADFDYSLSYNGSLDIEIGGKVPGNDYDVLGGSGNKDLGGTLNVLLYNNYIPTAGESFTIVTGGSITDTFTTINYHMLPNNMTWEIVYNPNTVVLKVNAATSISDVAILKNISLHPNPTSGKISIKGLQHGIFKYNVYTITGQQIESGTVVDNTIYLKSQLSQTVFVEIIDDSNRKTVMPISLVR